MGVHHILLHIITHITTTQKTRVYPLPSHTPQQLHLLTSVRSLFQAKQKHLLRSCENGASKTSSLKRISPRPRPSRYQPSPSKTHPHLRLLRHLPPSLSRPRWSKQHSRTIVLLLLAVLWLRRTGGHPASPPRRARQRSRLSPRQRRLRVRPLSLQVIWRG